VPQNINIVLSGFPMCSQKVIFYISDRYKSLRIVGLIAVTRKATLSKTPILTLRLIKTIPSIPKVRYIFDEEYYM
jgi:hypothetical protein